MAQRLMHNGKPWIEEGFPPDSPDRVAVRGVDAETPVCTCGPEWQKEGHAPTCAAARDPQGVKSITGNARAVCTCDRDWAGEGHAKGCPARPAVAPCDCRARKWDGEGHDPACVSRQVADAEPEKRKRK